MSGEFRWEGGKEEVDASQIITVSGEHVRHGTLEKYG
jgi:hypothetical protein